MRVLVVGCLMLMAACGSDTAPADLRLAHGIVGGQHQVVTAGAKQLVSGVVEQLARTESGALTMRRVATTGALLDARFDGTVVTGSPVVGAVVCAQNPSTPHTLVAFSQCTNTDTAGKATFFFSPQTAAGTDSAEIRGTVTDANGTVEPAVFDTAFATVTAGPVSGTYKIGPGTVRTLPAIVTDSSVQDAYGNPIPFRIVDPAGALVLADTTFGSVGARTIVDGPHAEGGVGYVVELRAADGTLLGHARYEITSGQLGAWLAVGLDVVGGP